jgi:hypothetical protein
MGLKRHDWASRMFEQMELHKHREFQWGVNDCCLFVARVIDSMTDSDLVTVLQAAYSDERSALKFIAFHGDLASAVSAYLGEPVVRRPVRGDAVLFDGGEGDALGICIGTSVVAVGPTGLRIVPRPDIRKVWPQ